MSDDVIPLNEIGKIETVKVYNQAYVDKQQKRIEELEITNKKISDECHKLVDSLEKEQKENAELKEKYAKNITDCDICDTYCNSQLTNAKEIIKKFLLWENDWHNKTESKYELLKQAEQFLKDCEVEK